MNQDNTDGLIGVDPDDTMDVEMGGATFVVGPVPGDVWEKLSGERALLLQDSVRRAIKRISDRGENPDDFWVDRKRQVSTMTKLEVESSSDPSYRHAMIPVMVEGAKHALRDHRKFLTRKREPIPFKRSNGVVEEETLRYYRVNVTVLEAVWLHLYILNTLGDQGKKA